MSSSRLLGFRFQPTDEELLGYYLYRKLHGNSSMEDLTVILDYDLYGKEEPSEIWGRFGGDKLENEDLYFFTHLKKKKDSHRIFERKVGVNGGKWHGEDSGSPIKVAAAVDGGRKVIVEGCRKRFNYRNPGSEEDRAWIMHEYSLDRLRPDFVVCRLRKNAKNNKLSKRSSCSNQEEEQPHLPNPKRIKRAEAATVVTEVMPLVVQNQSSLTTTREGEEINGGGVTEEDMFGGLLELTPLVEENEITSHIIGNDIDDGGMMMMEDQVVCNTHHQTTNYYHQNDDDDDLLMMNPYNCSSSSSEMAMVQVEDDHQFDVEDLLLLEHQTSETTTTTDEVVDGDDLWNLISIDEQDVGGLTCWEEDLLYTTLCNVTH